MSLGSHLALIVSQCPPFSDSCPSRQSWLSSDVQVHRKVHAFSLNFVGTSWQGNFCQGYWRGHFTGYSFAFLLHDFAWAWDYWCVGLNLRDWRRVKRQAKAGLFCHYLLMHSQSPWWARHPSQFLTWLLGNSSRRSTFRVVDRPRPSRKGCSLFDDECDCGESLAPFPAFVSIASCWSDSPDEFYFNSACQIFSARDNHASIRLTMKLFLLYSRWNWVILYRYLAVGTRCCEWWRFYCLSKVLWHFSL